MLLRGKVRETQGEMFMKTKLRRSIASLLIVSMTGCAGPHKLARDDQLSLASRPKIHAVHHSPATVFMVRQHTAGSLLLATPAVLETISEGERLQREQQVVDPAPRVKGRLVSALQGNLNLRNVHTVSDSPQNDDVKTLKSLFNTGIVLDVRTMKWGLGTVDARAIYSARARMISLEDSTVIWEATCSARSADGWDRGAKLLQAADDCAAQLSAQALGKDHKPVLVTGHTIPAEGLPSVPRIVVDEQPIELTGFEMTPEERARFEEQRSARIDSRAKIGGGVGGLDPRCILILPVCVVAIVGTLAVVSGVKHAKASAREPSLVPEQEGARFAASLKEQATGASLAERILRSPKSASVPATMEAESPRLVVRMKVARPDYSGTRAGVAIVAQAQAFPSTGAEWEPTEHRYEFPSAPGPQMMLSLSAGK